MLSQSSRRASLRLAAFWLLLASPLLASPLWAFSFLAVSLPARADDPHEDAPVAEIQLCRRLARHEVVRDADIEGYLELLTRGDVAGWNKKRQADGGKLLDLAGKTWDTRGRADLVLALDSLDLHGIDLSNVLFMPGTVFRFCDLSNADLRGSCLEGVAFSSLASFEARARDAVRTTSLAGADLRDIVWTWDTTLERQVRRSYPEAAVAAQSPEQLQARKDRRRAELDRRIAELDGNAPPAFQLVDTAGSRLDDDAPGAGADDPLALAYSKALGRLVHAATAGKLAETVKSLTDRHRQATVERANPLADEPVLAAAIAAVDSDLAGIETWRAVSVTNVAGDAPVILVGGKRTLLVVDDERSLAGARLLVSSCPVYAWRRGILPPTVCSRAVVLKDQAAPQGPVVGAPVFALAQGLRGEARRVPETAGTFASPVVAEVEGVEMLSLEDADRRVLRGMSIRSYAQSLGESEGSLNVPALRSAQDPKEALSARLRKAIEASVGKDALADMRCYKLSAQKTAQGWSNVLCTDPHAILIVDKTWSSGPVYARGPVVVLDPEANCPRRIVTKGWLCVRGALRPNSDAVSQGPRIEVDTSDDPVDQEDAPGKKGDAPRKRDGREAPREKDDDE